MSSDNRLQALVQAQNADDTPAMVVARATVYLAFLEGSPVAVEAPSAALALEAAKVTPKAAKAKAAATATAQATSTTSLPSDPAVVQPATLAPVATIAAPTPASVPTAETIAPPADLAACAAALKALVQDAARGGRAACVALLKEFGVEQLSQIPGAKLGEFKRRCEATAAVAVAEDPTGGLLG